MLVLAEEVCADRLILMLALFSDRFFSIPPLPEPDFPISHITVPYFVMKRSILSSLWPLALQPSLSLAYWRMACSVSQTARVDIILNPGGVSGHVHKFAGGNSESRFPSRNALPLTSQISIKTPTPALCKRPVVHHVKFKPTSQSTGHLSCTTLTPMALSKRYQTSE